VATALRIVSAFIVAKAVVIGVVYYWRRTEMLGRPNHIGTASWGGLIAVLAVAVALEVTVHVAARHHNGDRMP
jgi:amino acid transporter